MWFWWTQLSHNAMHNEYVAGSENMADGAATAPGKAHETPN